ncbi:MAG TPA: DUF234 domain-containing protein [Candidatus Paceibacterota bacterium]|nr:DUF234 domain-containing protein [Candidatus Paceibacterota bacterium]
MSGFIGRGVQIAVLNKILEQISTNDDNKPGQALLMRGRRRVGKSRLVEEFLDRAGVPNVFFTASKQTTQEELQLFAQAVLESSLPDKAVFDGVNFESWDAALRLLANALPSDVPSVIVIDELPYLMESDQAFEGTLQKIFDRYLSRHKVLFIGIGSDLAMMEALNEYGRPFHQRATEMVIPPLSPAEVADMLGLSAADAFDAYLITGGLPLICNEWRKGLSIWKYLESALSSSTSALIVSGERSIAAEFPPDAQARNVLTAIGSGERTFSNIGKASGGLQQTSISRSLKILTDKRIVVAEVPLSTRISKETRYRIADPYIRFWLSFLGPNLAEIERGRGDRVLEKIRTSWTSWRGRTIEPIIRESIERIPNPRQPDVSAVVGAYWTRTNQPEIDLIVADRGRVASAILEVGSIKWLEKTPFGTAELNQLIAHRAELPGATPDTPLVIVSRAGFNVTPTPDVRELSPEDLLKAWR